MVELWHEQTDSRIWLCLYGYIRYFKLTKPIEPVFPISQNALVARIWTCRLIQSSGTARTYKEEMSFWIASQETEVNTWKSKHEISWSWFLSIKFQVTWLSHKTVKNKETRKKAGIKTHFLIRLENMVFLRSNSHGNIYIKVDIFKFLATDLKSPVDL